MVAEPAVTAAIDPVFRALGFSAGGASHAAISVVFVALINILHAMTVPADLSVANLIDQFQVAGQELALVVDPTDESVVGLVTATDALEVITGELSDPLDQETPAARTADPTISDRSPDDSGTD